MKKLFSILAAVLFAGSMMAETVTLTMEDFADVSFTDQTSGISVSTAKNAGQTAPAYNATGKDLRVYAKGSITIEATKNITSISFTISDKGKNRLAPLTANVGSVVVAGDPDFTAEWTGSATSVTLTVGDIASYGTESTKAGQLCFTAIVVTLGEGEEPVEPGDEPVVEPAALITFGDTAVAKGTWSNGAVIADKDSLVKLTLVDPEAKIAIDLNEANFGTKEEYVTLKSRLKTGGKSSSSKNYINVEVAKNGKLYIMARTGSNSATDRNVVITNGTDTIFNQLLLESNATVVPLTDSTSMKIYPVYSASLNTGVTYRISYPVNGVNFYGFDFVPEDEPVVEPEEPKNLGAKTIAEFLELKNTTDTCILTGVVSNIQNTTYGNFDLTDESGKVYVYGLLTPAGESKKFADLNVAENDTLTVLAIYNEHNGNPQAKNAIFVEVKKSSAPVVEPVNLGEKTIAEFLALKNTKDTCILTGVVSNIVNDVYGNFDLIDATDTVYVYGLLTPAGESKKFAELNVAENDTLTVLAIYNEFNGNPQAKNAIFVEVKKAPKAPAQDVEVTLSSITTPGSLIWADATATSGWWQIMGGNDSYEFSLSNAGEIAQAAGTYTADDLDPDFSYISLYGATDTVDVAFTDGSVTVAIDAEGIVTINGTLVGSDGNNYIFNLTYKEPVAENTVEVQVSEANLIDDYAEYNLYGVYGYADDKTAYVQLGIWTEEGAGFEGQFTEDYLDFEYIGSAVIDATGSHDIFAAEITVTPGNTEGVYSITAKLLCYNNTLYVVTMQIGENIDDAIDHITNAVKASKLLRDGQLIIEKNGVRYNVNGQRIK